MASEQDHQNQAEGQPDLPPEQLHYRDNGCKLHPKCLSCPREVCVLDLGPDQASIELRRNVVAGMHKQKRPLAQIARSLGVTSSVIRGDLRAIQRRVSGSGG